MELSHGLNDYSIPVNGIEYYFQCRFVQHANEAILFVHGLACSHATFGNVFDKDYFPDKSLLLVDQIGFGKSAKPELFSYKMEDQALLLNSLLSQLPKFNWHIVAHSMGAAVALLMQADFLSNILSFTNIEGNLISDDCGILSRGISAIPYEMYRDDLYKNHLVDFEGHHQLHFEESTPLAVYKSAKSLVEWSDSGELLAKFQELECRKSYFYGEENQSMPILKKLNSIKKFMIQSSGHGMTTENPKEFYAKLVEFINSP